MKKGQLINFINRLSEDESSAILRNLNNGSLLEKLFLHLRDQSPNSKKVVPNQAVRKHQLYQSILNSLTYHHRNSSAEIRALHIRQRVETLLLKEEIEICHKELKKLNQIADDYGILEEQIFCARTKMRLLSRTHPADSQEVQLVLHKLQDLLEDLKIEKVLWEYSFTIFQSSDSFETQLIRFRSDVPSPPSSYYNLVKYANIQFTLLTLCNDEKQAEDQLIGFIGHIEKHDRWILNSPRPYIVLINNLIGMYVRSHRHSDVKMLLKKIRSLSDAKDQFDQALYPEADILRTYNIEMELYRDTENWQAAGRLYPTMKSRLESSSPALAEKFRPSFYFQFAYIHFMLKNYQLSIFWNNELSGIQNQHRRPDLLLHSKVINLMIQYEIGNFSVLGYSILSVRRFLSRHFNTKEQNTLRPVLALFSQLVRRPKPEHPKIMKSTLAKLNVDEEYDWLKLERWITWHLEGLR